MPSTRTEFRRDINALRAIAVAAVMLFHFRILGISGGFAGVDVFFVISGYLMTSIIVTARARGEFTVASFLLARAARILPALFVLASIVLLLSLLLLPPVDVRSIARYATFALVFWSNQILAGESGYFAPASDENPFLHTWSLSLEWQFYLLLPLVLTGSGHIRRQAWFVLVTALIASAAYAALEPSQNIRFFSLGTRAWELAAGGLTFLASSGPLVRGSDAKLRALAAWLGMTLILASMLVINAFKSWPLPWAALPVIGTCLVIAARRDTSLYGWKPVQALGQWSYSVYLWHWPCVVTLRLLHREADPAWVAVAMVLSILFGYFSYRWIENPARRWLRALSWRGNASVACGWLVAVGLAALLVKAEGLPQRQTALAEGLHALKTAEADWTFPARCVNWKSGGELTLCSLHLEVTTQKPWLVVGDSHAQHLWPYFDARSKDRRIDFMTSGGCPPLPGLNTAAPGYDCPRVFDRVRGLVQTGRYERVIVASWWDGYFVGDAPLCVWQKGRCQDAVIGLDDARPAFDAAVAIWSEWRGRGVDVFVVLPEPRLRVNQPREMARRRYLGLDESPAEFISQDDYFRSVGPVRAEVARAARLAGAAVIDPAAQLCHEGQCRFVDGAGHPILRDGSHFRSSWAAQGMHYPDELLRGTSKAQEVGTLDSRPRP